MASGQVNSLFKFAEFPEKTLSNNRLRESADHRIVRMHFVQDLCQHRLQQNKLTLQNYPIGNPAASGRLSRRLCLGSHDPDVGCPPLILTMGVNSVCSAQLEEVFCCADGGISNRVQGESLSWIPHSPCVWFSSPGKGSTIVVGRGVDFRKLHERNPNEYQVDRPGIRRRSSTVVGHLCAAGA